MAEKNPAVASGASFEANKGPTRHIGEGFEMPSGDQLWSLFSELTEECLLQSQVDGVARKV
jgi:hypothetical protein